jgi:hypothetical protein
MISWRVMAHSSSTNHKRLRIAERSTDRTVRETNRNPTSGQMPNSPAAEFEILRFGKIGAGEGIRTLDPDLGKVVLYP